MIASTLQPLSVKTTAGRFTSCLLIAFFLLSLVACGSGSSPKEESHEEEAIARTEFTDRVENFFEYESLKAGKTSQFLIHITDLSDGSPVEKADVILTIRSQRNGAEAGQVKARVGKVTGIYVADVSIPEPGVYDIDFRIKNDKLDERMPLKDFNVD